MEILELHMQNFGKFQEHRVKLLPGVNIIYGGNETGKTTIHSFIRAMFFGIERGRGKAGRKDEYQLRQPWDNPSWFAGTMRVKYEGKIYRIERNFHKNEKAVRLICETTGEELSTENGEISVLLSGMSEAAFRNTVFISQNGCETDEGLADELQKFMMNFQETGDGSLDLAKALEHLKKQKKNLEGKKRQEQELLDEKIARKQMELDYVKREIELKKQQAISAEERDAGTKENENRMENERYREEETDRLDMPSETSGTFLFFLNLLLFLCSTLGFACSIFALNMGMRIGMLAVGMVFAVVFGLVLKYSIKNRRKYSAKAQRIEAIDNLIKQKPRQQTNKQEEAVRQEDKLLWKKEEEKKALQEKRIQLEAFGEELEELYAQREQLISYEQEIEAIDLAMLRMKEVAAQIYREAGNQFGHTASRILSELTEGRYTHLSMDEKMEIRINTPSRLLHLYQVSCGAMNQIYFALRMAAGQLLSGGRPVPIILDEAFAMYDEERLAEALRWLDSCGRQVILFTCQTREKRILDEVRQGRR